MPPNLSSRLVFSQSPLLLSPLCRSFSAVARILSQMDLAERVVSLARGRYDDATALVVVFE